MGLQSGFKWVNQIELSSDENYRGYWEKGGYSNDASLEKPFFERMTFKIEIKIPSFPSSWTRAFVN